MLSTFLMLTVLFFAIFTIINAYELLHYPGSRYRLPDIDWTKDEPEDDFRNVRQEYTSKPVRKTGGSPNYIVILLNPDIPGDSNCKGQFGDVSFQSHKTIKAGAGGQNLESDLTSLLSWAQESKKMNTVTISVQTINQDDHPSHSAHPVQKSQRLNRSHRRVKRVAVFEPDADVESAPRLQLTKSYIPIVIERMNSGKTGNSGNSGSNDNRADASKDSNLEIYPTVEYFSQSSGSNPMMVELTTASDHQDDAPDGIIRKINDDIPLFEILPPDPIMHFNNINPYANVDEAVRPDPPIDRNEDEDLNQPVDKYSLKVERHGTTKSYLKDPHSQDQECTEPSHIITHPHGRKDSGTTEKTQLATKGCSISPGKTKDRVTVASMYIPHPPPTDDKKVVTVNIPSSDTSTGQNEDVPDDDVLTSDGGMQKQNGGDLHPSLGELLNLVSAIKQQFYHTFLDSMEMPGNSPSLRTMVERMLGQLAGLHGENGYIAIIRGGNVSDLKNCSSDLVRTLHLVFKNCDLQNTVVIMTASCPSDNRLLPFLVTGPGCDQFDQVQELCDLPHALKAHMQGVGKEESREIVMIRPRKPVYRDNQPFDSFPMGRFGNERQLAESLVEPADMWYDEMGGYSEMNKPKRNVDDKHDLIKRASSRSTRLLISRQLLAFICFLIIKTLFN